MSPDSRVPHGEVFLDPRGEGRALRLTWHHEADVVVLSLWRDRTCAGTFRLATADVNDFVDALVDGIRDAHGATPSQRPTVDTGEVHFGEPPAVSDPAPANADAPRNTSFSDWAFGDDPSRATA
jgi:hypothetical protein